MGRDTSKFTLLRDARPSFAKWPGLLQLKQVRRDWLSEGVCHAWVLERVSEDLGMEGEMGNEFAQKNESVRGKILLTVGCPGRLVVG